MNPLFISIYFSLITFILPSYGFDMLDPQGNITIKWDVLQSDTSTYDAMVSIFNYQLFRHVERPGWKLSWTWQNDEVIWFMLGSEATLQGNCSAFKGKQLPHCCEKTPVIIDFLPGAPYNVQSANCCKGGVLSSMTQDPSMYGASFQMNVGIASNNVSDIVMPTSFNLGLPGYSCGEPVAVKPSRFTKDKGRRWTQALGTWNVTCIYNQLGASIVPTCCVSLSAFYNTAIVPCPHCSCGCQDQPRTKCVKPGETPSILQLQHDAEEEPPALVKCSQHLCPIRVHWHVKQSYTQYWRVKITVTNLNYVKNYSHWTLVVQHPNLRSLTQVFSFNYMSLDLHGSYNDTGMFWGIPYYNDMLLQTGDNGNVQTEILLRKDAGNFTFNGGWAFPTKISFNGDVCVMPPPDEYPKLPNSIDRIRVRPSVNLLSLLLLIAIF